MSAIRYSVGNKGINTKSDVVTIQKLLNKKIASLKPLLPLAIDGVCGPLTIGLIKEYQRRTLGHKWPDGRVDPSGKTLSSLLASSVSSKNQITPTTAELLHCQINSSFDPPSAGPLPNSNAILTDRDYENAAIDLGVEMAAIKAVAQVESSGSGFTSSGLVRILFEGHQFHKRTNGKYSKTHPNISHANIDQTKYARGGLDERVRLEHQRLAQAITLDRAAALASASWGKFQVMGFNHKEVGWKDVESFVRDMKKSESEHLKAFIGYVKHRKLVAALRSKDWAAFARGYNGSQYHLFQYDIKMANAYNAYKRN